MRFGRPASWLAAFISSTLAGVHLIQVMPGNVRAENVEGRAENAWPRNLEMTGMSVDQATRAQVPSGIATPATVKSEVVGTLEFTDGYPTRETAARLRDHLDHLRGVETFMNTIQGVSSYALRDGFQKAGVADGDVLIFSELMDSRSLFLTGNADTVYFWTFLDLSQGPLVLETPADTLGLLDDMWFRWISDFGLPGADRGRGGTYLLVGPGYDGPLPEAATTSVTRAPTTCSLSAGRSSTRTPATTPPRLPPASRRS